MVWTIFVILLVLWLLGFFAFMVSIGTRYALLTWQQTTPVMEVPIGAVATFPPRSACSCAKRTTRTARCSATGTRR